MKSRPDGSSEVPRPSLWMVVAGVLFLVGWMAASAVWFVMSMMGSLMANDSGAVSESGHAAMMVVLLCGQVLTTVSGVAGGLAFFWRVRRRILLAVFCVLLAVGVFCQYQAVRSFVNEAAGRG